MADTPASIGHTSPKLYATRKHHDVLADQMIQPMPEYWEIAIAVAIGKHKQGLLWIEGWTTSMSERVPQ